MHTSGHVWDGEHGRVFGEAKNTRTEDLAKVLANDMHEQMTGRMDPLVHGGRGAGDEESPEAKSELDKFQDDFFNTPAPPHREPNGLRDSFDDDFKEPECEGIGCVGKWVGNLFGGDTKKEEEEKDEDLDLELAKKKTDVISEAPPVQSHSVSMSWNNGKLVSASEAFGNEVDGFEVHKYTPVYGAHRNMPESLIQGKSKSKHRHLRADPSI